MTSSPAGLVIILKLSWLICLLCKVFPSCVQACVCFGPVVKITLLAIIWKKNFIPMLCWSVFNNWLSGGKGLDL